MTNINFRMLVLGALLFQISCPASPVRVGNTNGVSPSELIDLVRSALISTQTELLELEMPQLDSVELTLALGSQVDTDGNVSLLVLTNESSASEEQTQTMSFTLEPPPPCLPQLASLDDAEKLLSNAIITTARAKKAISDAAEHGDNPLQVTEVSVELGFSIGHSGTEGISLEIFGEDIGITRTTSNSLSHEIRITFEDPNETVNDACLQ